MLLRKPHVLHDPFLVSFDAHIELAQHLWNDFPHFNIADIPANAHPTSSALSRCKISTTQVMGHDLPKTYKCEEGFLHCRQVLLVRIRL